MGFVAPLLVHAELLQVNPLYTDASSSQLDTLLLNTYFLAVIFIWHYSLFWRYKLKSPKYGSVKYSFQIQLHNKHKMETHPLYVSICINKPTFQQ